MFIIDMVASVYIRKLEVKKSICPYKNIPLQQDDAAPKQAMLYFSFFTVFLKRVLNRCPNVL
jgi:hypothetical protein